MQRIENPFPDIPYPDWVSRMMARKTNQQKSLNNYFSQNVGNNNRIISVNKDIEDFGKIEEEKMDIINDEDDNNDLDEQSSSKKRKSSCIYKFIKYYFCI